MKNPCEPGSPSFPHPIGGPRAVWLLTKDRWSVTPSSAVPEQTTHCADNKKVACPLMPSRAEQTATRAAEQMGNGFVDFVLNLKSVSWYCHEIDLFTLECMFVSSFYYQELWVFFLSKVIWSYKINLQNNSNEWPKSEKDIFRLSFRLECTKKITNNSNSFSFCFYLLNYGMLRLLFGKKKKKIA